MAVNGMTLWRRFIAQGASVAMTKMAKAMKQAKKAQERESAKAALKAERQHQKELRRAKALAIKQAQATGTAQQQPKKEIIHEGWLQKKGSKGIGTHRILGSKGGKGWSWRWFQYVAKDHQLLYCKCMMACNAMPTQSVTD